VGGGSKEAEVEVDVVIEEERRRETRERLISYSRTNQWNARTCLKPIDSI